MYIYLFAFSIIPKSCNFPSPFHAITALGQRLDITFVEKQTAARQRTDAYNGFTTTFALHIFKFSALLTNCMSTRSVITTLKEYATLFGRID